MDNKEQLQAMFQTIAENEGIPAVEFDEKDSCVLPYGEGRMLLIQYIDPLASVSFLTSLGSVPDKKRAAVYGELLGANLFWGETHGATLALNPTSGEVVLQFKQPMEGLYTELLQNILEGFLMTAEAFDQKLQGWIAGAKEEDEDDEAGDNGAADVDAELMEQMSAELAAAVEAVGAQE